MSSPAGGASALSLSCARTLADWAAPSSSQEELRRLFAEHVDASQDGWARSHRGSHLTASSLVCAPAQHQVLLTLHAKIGRWLQTGGHLEGDDPSLEHAALREAREESGLTELGLDPAPLLLSKHALSCGGQRTFHLDVQFLGMVEAPLTPTYGSESLDVSWYDWRSLPTVDESVSDLVQAAASRLGWT